MNIISLKSGVSGLNFYGNKFLDNLIFYGGKLVGRIIFPIQLITNSGKNISHQTYFPECDLKSKFRIFTEQLFYIFRTGEINKNYFIFGFDRKSKTDFKNYVPWLTFTHARNTKNQRPVKPEYDSYNHICLLRDKFVFEAFCKRLGINTPANIGMINSGELFLIKENKFIPIEEIINFEFDAFCKRNVSYGGGMPDNIIKLLIKNKGVFINNEEVSFEEFRALLGNDIWIVQERIKNQSAEYAQFHPQSINTIRVVTIRNGSEISILCAFFRMGVNGRHADNWSSGGIGLGVNIENGTLEKWGLYKPGLGTKSDRHPNSEILFEGYILPYWYEIVEYAKNAHRLFYGLHSIGWDVSVTTEGIMIIEGNDNWDTIDAQYCKGGRKEFDKYFK
jgi:hypothetical protein